MSYVDECVEKFNKLPPELLKLITSQERLKFLEDLRTAHGADLRFLIILFFTFELGIEDIKEYLELKFGFSDELATTVTKELVTKLIEPVASDFNEIAKKWREENILERKGQIIDIFEKDIVRILRAIPAIQKRTNIMITELLSEFPGLERSLSQKLLENKEKLTHKFFQIGENTMRPTVGNWIKYLIQSIGSDNFDNIALSKFMIVAPNIRNLSSEEKSVILKLYRLYRNVTFFNENFRKDRHNEWEFVPIEYRDEPRQRPAVTQQNLEQIELEKMLANFPAGSLERKAVEEELHKLKIKN